MDANVSYEYLQSNDSLLNRWNGSPGYDAAYDVAFSLDLFAYLRIWNLVPSSERAFDSTRQLVVGDVKCEAEGLVLHLKLAKNLQSSDQYHVRVSRINLSCALTIISCTVYALKAGMQGPC